jgi:amidophosphoribosyltransferase
VQEETVRTTDIAHKVAHSLGADFVAYNNTSTLAKAINIAEKELCFTCTTGDYSPLGVKPLFKSRAVLKGRS